MEARVKDVKELGEMIDNLAEHGATEISAVRQDDGSYIVRWTIDKLKEN